jgi:hypothetical protein
MIIFKYNDIMKFYDNRKKCTHHYFDGILHNCELTSKKCDEDICPLVTDSLDIDDWLDNVNRSKVV